MMVMRRVSCRHRRCLELEVPTHYSATENHQELAPTPCGAAMPVAEEVENQAVAHLSRIPRCGRRQCVRHGRRLVRQVRAKARQDTAS